MLGLAIRELAAVCTELQGVIKMDLAFLKETLNKSGPALLVDLNSSVRPHRTISLHDC